MRLLGILLSVLLLTSVCLAEKTWTSAPDKLSLKAGDDFQKSTDALEGTSLALFSEKKNAQLLLTKSGGEVSTDQFIKAFPVLSEEKKFKVESGPTKINVAGASAVMYELQKQNIPNYHTIYVYVGRGGKKAYSLILNYPAPRDPAMVSMMKQILASIKHQ